MGLKFSHHPKTSICKIAHRTANHLEKRGLLERGERDGEYFSGSPSAMDHVHGFSTRAPQNNSGLSSHAEDMEIFLISSDGGSLLSSIS